MPADPVRAAIFARLNADADLRDLLSAPGAIFEEKAPSGTDLPYVVFQRTSGVDQWTFGDGNERTIWLVKGVCQGTTSKPAEEIDARCRDLLHKARLAVPGGTLAVLRESAVSYGEEPSGEQYSHRGAKYLIFT